MRRWLGPVPVAVAWLVLAVAAVHPPGGLPVTLCALRAATGVPCPGCGLTRSVSCTARGRLSEGVALHPMGPPILCLAAAIAAAGAAPPRWRRRLAAAIGHRPAPANLIYWSFVAAFVAAGLVRWLA